MGWVGLNLYIGGGEPLEYNSSSTRNYTYLSSMIHTTFQAVIYYKRGIEEGEGRGHISCILILMMPQRRKVSFKNTSFGRLHHYPVFSLLRRFESMYTFCANISPSFFRIIRFAYGYIYIFEKDRQKVSRRYI